MLYKPKTTGITLPKMKELVSFVLTINPKVVKLIPIIHKTPLKIISNK